MPDFRGEVEATDNFDGSSELITTQSPDPNTVIMGPDNKVTLTVKDRSGNAAEVSFNVTVSGREPILNCTEDHILTLDEGQTVYTVPGTEFDPLSLEFYCGSGSLTNNINGSPTLKNAEFSEDTTYVEWTLSDDAGNKAICSFNVIIQESVGIESLQEHGISIYPNPTTGDIFIESFTPVRRVRFLDLKGSILMDRTDILEYGQINIAGYERGQYILNIMTDQQVFNVRIVKE
jgi:hypothetical protein